MPMMKIGSSRRASMRGLSLVELMVGVAVSLFVVAAAALLVSSQLTDNRKLLLETQLQQDLRSTADIVTRELRRSGYWVSARSGVPDPVSGAIETNPLMALAVTSSASSTVHYNYQRLTSTGASGIRAFGFKLNDNGVIVACQSDGTNGVCPSALDASSGWQELTDRNTVYITEFRISTERATNAANDDSLVLPCPYPCADGTAACWPKVNVRELTVVIKGQSRSDPNVQRTLTSSVRVRNDRLQVSSEAPANQACPAG